MMYVLCYTDKGVYIISAFGYDHIPLSGILMIAVVSGSVCAVAVKLFLVPWQRKKIKCKEYY